jgi:hypothetical protein
VSALKIYQCQRQKDFGPLGLNSSSLKLVLSMFNAGKERVVQRLPIIW